MTYRQSLGVWLRNRDNRSELPVQGTTLGGALTFYPAQRLDYGRCAKLQQRGYHFLIDTNHPLSQTPRFTSAFRYGYSSQT